MRRSAKGDFKQAVSVTLSLSHPNAFNFPQFSFSQHFFVAISFYTPFDILFRSLYWLGKIADDTRVFALDVSPYIVFYAHGFFHDFFHSILLGTPEFFLLGFIASFFGLCNFVWVFFSVSFFGLGNFVRVFLSVPGFGVSSSLALLVEGFDHFSSSCSILFSQRWWCQRSFKFVSPSRRRKSPDPPRTNRT